MMRRTEAAIQSIAEIIGQFDLVAIVELRNSQDARWWQTPRQAAIPRQPGWQRKE